MFYSSWRGILRDGRGRGEKFAFEGGVEGRFPCRKRRCDIGKWR